MSLRRPSSAVGRKKILRAEGRGYEPVQGDDPMFLQNRSIPVNSGHGYGSSRKTGQFRSIPVTATPLAKNRSIPVNSGHGHAPREKPVNSGHGHAPREKPVNSGQFRSRPRPSRKSGQFRTFPDSRIARPLQIPAPRKATR